MVVSEGIVEVSGGVVVLSGGVVDGSVAVGFSAAVSSGEVGSVVVSVVGATVVFVVLSITIEWLVLSEVGVSADECAVEMLDDEIKGVNTPLSERIKIVTHTNTSTIVRNVITNEEEFLRLLR